MLKSLSHPNITQFIGVCSKPLAIMMEYEYFNFIPFGLNHKISNLQEFTYATFSTLSMDMEIEMGN